MFSFLNLDLSYWRYQSVYFDIICADVVYPPGKKVIPIYSFLLQSKTFLMYIMYNILAKRRILKNFQNTESFLSFWHLQFCSNF